MTPPCNSGLNPPPYMREELYKWMNTAFIQSTCGMRRSTKGDDTEADVPRDGTSIFPLSFLVKDNIRLCNEKEISRILLKKRGWTFEGCICWIGELLTFWGTEYYQVIQLHSEKHSSKYKLCLSYFREFCNFCWNVWQRQG